MAVFLTTTDEKLAAGIMHMLNCGTAQDIFNSIADSKDNIQTITLMKQALALDREDLSAFLEEKKLPDHIMDMLYCRQPETYVVVMDDLLPIFPVVQQISMWNFAASEAPELMDMPQEQAVQLLQEKHGMTEEEAKLVFKDLFEEKTITSIEQFICSRDQNKVDCIIPPYNFEIDLSSMDAHSGSYYPEQFIFIEDEKVHIKNFDENTIPYVLIFFNRTGTHVAILVKPEVAYSMYIKMLLLEGYGLQHFEQFTDYARPETKHVVSYTLRSKV